MFQCTVLWVSISKELLLLHVSIPGNYHILISIAKGVIDVFSRMGLDFKGMN